MMLVVVLILLSVSCVTDSLSFENRLDEIVHCIEKERQALVAFRANLTYDGDGGFFSSWNTKNCCKWNGVECNNITGRVVKLDLYGGINIVAGNISPSLLELQELNYLDLSFMSIENNPIPNFFGSFTKLKHLRLCFCHFIGNIPSQLGNLTNLNYLALSSSTYYSYTNLSVENIDWLTRLSSLHTLKMEGLDLSRVTNWVDIIKTLPLLSTLSLRNCQLSKAGSPSSINSSSAQIKTIDLSSNGLTSSMYSWLFNLSSSLIHLTLRDNLLNGPIFKDFGVFMSFLQYLDLSSNLLEGSIPNSFGNLSNFIRMDMGGNHEYPGIDLSSNNFEGPVPLFPSTLASINLSRNKFSGTLSFLCQLSDAALSFLDISNNLLAGELPDCFGKLKELIVVNLAHNSLSGEIPSSLGYVSRLEMLNLYNNSLSGELPLSLSSCERLSFMDVGENKLTGNIPSWIGGNILQLNFFSLRSNNFSGTIPLKLCKLYKLQVLDLSINNLLGNIPSCLSNLSAMVQKGLEINDHEFPFAYSKRSSTTLSCYISSSYAHYSVIQWQGRELEFGNNLRLMKIIDLSSNKLSGEIPYEITMIFELVALNLSRNALQGNVPQQIGQLKSITFLDLSRNEFSGKIPASLSQLSFLNYLDLSYNKFSGRIPSGTQLQSFEGSKFIGNVGLCGPPLATKCSRDEAPPTVVGNEDNNGEENEDDEFMKWLYIGLASGFITGFWGICGALFLNRSGRHALFLFVDHMKDRIYVKMAARRV